jgi:hypothetical protein
MQMRPPLCGGLIFSQPSSGPDWRPRVVDTISNLVRPATAIVLVILLVIITVAGIIQLFSILSPPG